MTARARVIAYGSAAALVAAGVVCAIASSGRIGEVVALALITLGLGAILLLVFLEIGLGEDRDRAADDERRRIEAARRAAAQPRPRRPRLRRPRRPV
jgi:hypothetical protein